jgi:pimeloyl-ACP methyl ester carboxylesterase
MPKVPINEIELYYEIHGDGIPLLLIAGLASDSQSWQPVIDKFSSRCQVITIDNRGVGRTSPLVTETNIHVMAADCLELIRHLGLKSINVLGHSMGGFVAQEFAITYPECVDKLILVATSSSNSRRNNALFSNWALALEAGLDLKLWFRNIFYWIFSARFFEDERAVEDAVRFAVEYPYPQSPVAFRNQVNATTEFSCVNQLSSIAAKTLVIGGKDDLLFSVQECTSFAKRIPGAMFIEIENAAHSIHMENPCAFSRAVLDFLFQT